MTLDLIELSLSRLACRLLVLLPLDGERIVSGTQAIKMLESRAKDWYYVNPETHQELAATLREAKVLIEGACDALETEGIGEEFIQRAQRWLEKE